MPANRRSTRSVTPGVLASRALSRRRARLEATLSRNRVVLALFQLADPSGVFVRWSVARIAAVAGRSTSTVRRVLARMIASREIVMFSPWSRGACPIMVLMDGQEAVDGVLLLLEQGFKLNSASRAAQAGLTQVFAAGADDADGAHASKIDPNSD